MIDELRHMHPLKHLLVYLSVTKAIFYYHLKRLKQADKHQAIKADMVIAESPLP